MTTPAIHPRLVEYLGHMLDAIERCHDYVNNMDEVTFLRDRKTQDAVIRTFEVIGEASNNICKRYPDFTSAHPEVPFGVAIGMRNALAHGYFSVDLEILWKTIHNDLPELRQLVGRVLEHLS